MRFKKHFFFIGVMVFLLFGYCHCAQASAASDIENHWAKNDIETALGLGLAKEIYIVGLDATLCVDETAKASVRRGYKTTVLIDAVKTISNQPLDEIIANYKNEGILVTTSDQIWRM